MIKGFLITLAFVIAVGLFAAFAVLAIKSMMGDYPDDEDDLWPLA